ncbi:hypothetical protein TrST_g12372 [Triparma strigata]|uniref:Uncharacterized protein n=1 Tax=Triparma strigata TaxID=1606541 RepID=A0A9W7A551_9STRA|nr:hypothetical protein TrST_g12372 [Triparma strigata]
MPPSPNGVSIAIATSLKKASKTLSVGIEYAPAGADQTRGEIETLSMNLRKVSASAIFSSSLEHCKMFVNEQKTAEGSFPGPLPIIYTGEMPNVKEAVEAVPSLAAVVVDFDWEPQDLGSVQPIYRMTSPSQVPPPAASSFLVDCGSSASLASSIISSLPPSSLIIAAIPSMLPSSSELSLSQTLKSLGVHSILFLDACTGDSEDLEYSTFAISSLTKKKSKTFNMTGMTGSTNGHFGGVAEMNERTWLRKKREA